MPRSKIKGIQRKFVFILKQKMNILRYGKELTHLYTGCNQVRRLSNKSCIFTKPHRIHYLRLYPVLIVQPDGSTFTVRYNEPRGIIKLPLDISKVSEEERLKILENRRPKRKFIIQDEQIDDFDHHKYLKFIGKK